MIHPLHQFGLSDTFKCLKCSNSTLRPIEATEAYNIEASSNVCLLGAHLWQTNEGRSWLGISMYYVCKSCNARVRADSIELMNQLPGLLPPPPPPLLCRCPNVCKLRFHTRPISSCTLRPVRNLQAVAGRHPDSVFSTGYGCSLND